MIAYGDNVVTCPAAADEGYVLRECWGNVAILYKKLRKSSDDIQICRGKRCYRGEYEPRAHYWLESKGKAWDVQFGFFNKNTEPCWLYIIEPADDFQRRYHINDVYAMDGDSYLAMLATR
jgi:hypothetical protein